MLIASNEEEISHGPGAVANMLNSFRNGAVGFIDWLDAFGTLIFDMLRRRCHQLADTRAEAWEGAGLGAAGGESYEQSAKLLKPELHYRCWM